MKVLLVHNYYGSAAPSGENRVFDLERAMLERRGHSVAVYTRYSDELRAAGRLGLLRGALATPWNPFSIAAAARKARDFQPDVVHVHNTFPLISPAVFSGIPESVARVLTLHNYRLFCCAGIPLRDGRPCTECLESRSVLPAVRYGCYRGSRLATLPLAASLALHRRMGTWSRRVDAFIALTDFQRELMVQAGLPGDRVLVKPNFYPGQASVTPWALRPNRAVFVGRLAEEKGVSTLLEAWAMWGEAAPGLHVVGDGPLREVLQRRAVDMGLTKIAFLGQLAPPAAQAEIAAARLLLVPSTCYEGFPMVLAEAFACGTPAAVSQVGPLPAIVAPAGLVFSPSDPRTLVEVVRRAWSENGALAALAARARKEYEEKYAEETNYSMLMDVYGMARRRRGEL